jgi:hypothetical protein
MRFLDNLSKTLSSGVDRAKFETDKFQRTTKLSGEIGNYKAQIETNLRQLGERALELYHQGSLQAPEIASLAQIIAQLRDQQRAKEQELEHASAETFEQYQAANPQPAAPASGGQSVPISRESAEGGFPTPESSESSAIPTMSTDISGSGLPNSSSVAGIEPAGSTPYACRSCGYALHEGSLFCPNCGARVAGS